MEDIVTRLGKELADAISAAVADDARVEACRERARTAGYDLKITLEAVIGFAARSAVPAKVITGKPQLVRRSLEISPNDRRFLRSLRIAADEPEQVE